MAYAAKIKPMVNKVGNEECFKATWMVQNYAKLLQFYVNEMCDGISTPPSLPNKRSATAAALDDASLSPVETTRLLPPPAISRSGAYKSWVEG